MVSLQDVFRFQYLGGVDEQGRVNGAIRATGIRPTFADHLAELGINLSQTMFDGSPLGTKGKRG
jgi:pilus assembly protein CpaF